MESLYGCLADISKDLVCKAVNQLRYPCCFNHFVGELEKAEDNLIATRNSVEDRVASAEKQTRKTAEVVYKWLEDAKLDKDNVNQLLEKARKNKSCCFGHCPNWICRYILGKKLANKKRDLEKFIQEGRQYIQLERIATLPSDILDTLSEKCLNFESRQPAYEQVMEALKDDEVVMIGLYGMGGCGKTTLAMEVRKKAEAEHLFDKVLFVPVSSTVEVRRIQEKIASSMQYTFPENEEMERALRLCKRLTQEKKILIILDDVWEKLDFGAIGIPSSEHHKGCKILITTRSEAVCTSMDCQRKIHLPILTDEEAWALFQNKALISEGTPETIKHLARLISNECKGLPVAIAAVASSLKGKAEVIWHVALNKLRSSKPINIERGLPDPYKCLQLSYDYLDSEEAKSLFLLCSVFPEDYEIPIELLTRCAIGLGVVGEVRSYGEARNEVIAAKIELVSSCLLLDADDESVKMHDLVRDVAHLIAENEKKVIKCELEKDVTLEQNSIRYLWCVKFSNDLDCFNLEFLRIATKELEELDGIFESMGKLKVLYLINDHGYGKLPLSTMSFKTLSNLRCLILDGWELSDISFVRDMKKLQSLSLHDCSLPSFLELQTDAVVTQLTNLKSLELYGCDMKRKNFDLIKRIPLLEELYIIDIAGQWEAYSENTNEFFNTFSVPKTLQRYGIVLPSGYFYDYHQERFCSDHRTLSLPYFDTSNEVIKDLAKKAEDLSIGNIQGGAKSIIPGIFQMEGGGMNELNKLEIFSSDEIECLVDTSNHLSEVGTLFSKLVTLTIYNMDHLRALWLGFLPANGPFEKLEELYLDYCPQLTSLFTYAIARSLVQLKILKVSYCDGLKHILVDDDKREKSQDEFKIGHPVQSIVFQNLQEVEVKDCGGLKHVFSASMIGGLPRLKVLKIENCYMLEQIIGDIVPSAHQDQKEEPDEIIEEDEHQHFLNPHFESNQLKSFPESTSVPSAPVVNHSSGSFILSSLTSLVLISCPKLSSLFTASTAKTLTSLENLCIEDCDGLTYIWMASKNSFTLQYLKTLEIVRCARLEVIFPLSVLRCFPELERLAIRECKELKQIMEDKKYSNIVSTEPCFPKLEVVVVEKCHKLKRFFSVSASNDLPNLEDLIINGAAELEEIIGCEQGASKNSFTFPNLKRLIIMGCEKLEVIFPLSVLRCFPELERLYIRECKELKQIMEEDVEDKKLSNHVSTQPCFPKLNEVVVEQCHKLKRFFSVSASNDLPNLERLFIAGAAELEEIIGCGQEASKNSFSFRNLKSIRIVGCAKLEVIFPQHVLRCFPELESLEIRECKELKQIMEEDVEDKKLSNHVSTQPCFPKLAALEVQQCHKLKRFFSVSASNDLPNLELLIINGAAELEEIIGCEQGKGDDIGKVKVELPKLKLLIFMHLPNLLQGTELLAVKHRIVCNCPKLFLTSTTTLQELWQNIPNRDFENIIFFWRNLNFIIGQIYEDSTGSGTSELAELPSSQINEKSDKEIIGKVPGSELLATAISTKSEQNDRPSPNPLDISQRETHSQELVDGQSTSVSYLPDQQKPLGETESTIGIPQNIKRGVEEGTASENSTSSQSGSLVTSQHKSRAREWDSMPEKTSLLQKNQEDPEISKSEPSSSQVNDNNQSTRGNIVEMAREHKQIESGAPVSETHELLELERESKSTSHLEPLEQILSPISSPDMTEVAASSKVGDDQEPSKDKPPIPPKSSQKRKAKIVEDEDDSDEAISFNSKKKPSKSTPNKQKSGKVTKIPSSSEESLEATETDKGKELDITPKVSTTLQKSKQVGIGTKKPLTSTSQIEKDKDKEDIQSQCECSLEKAPKANQSFEDDIFLGQSPHQEEENPEKEGREVNEGNNEAPQTSLDIILQTEVPFQEPRKSDSEEEVTIERSLA